MSAPDDDTRKRKLAAKRNNERVKLLAGTLNAMSLTTFGAGILLPGINGAVVAAPWIWIFAALGLHLFAHAVYRLLRSED